MDTPSGGKSGTAQKIDPATGRYSATQYNASFVGFAPVNNPAITILVVLDSPVGQHHGSGSEWAGVQDESPNRCWRILACRMMCRRRPMWNQRRILKSLRRVLPDRMQQRIWRRCVFRKQSRANRPPKVPRWRSATSICWLCRASTGESVRGSHRGLLADRTGAVADWRWRCTGTVSGGRNASRAREPRDGEVWQGGPVRSRVGEGESKLTLIVGPKPRLPRDAGSERLKSARMKLRDLIAGAEIGEVSGPANPEIRSIAYDSRKAEPGSIFFALRGEKLEGVEFVRGALARGAIAVASEHPRVGGLPDEITWVELLAGLRSGEGWRARRQIFTDARRRR